MKALRGILLLFLLSCAIEGVFIGVYAYQANGPLKALIDEHTQVLREGVIPDASEIDIANAPWAKVARFEQTFSEMHLLIDPLFALLIIWFFMRRGISVAMRDIGEGRASNPHARRAVYLFLNVLATSLIFLPQIISAYLIGHMRGTDTTIPADAVWTALTDPIIAIVYTFALFIPLYWIIDRYKRRWWVVAAAFVSVFSLIMAFIGPIVIQPLYTQASPLEDGELKTALLEMTELAGVPIERIYVNDISWQSLESNAGVTGIGWTKRIELDDTLLRFYTTPEIVFIIAHELGHYVYGDLLIDALVSAVGTFAAFWVLSRTLRFWAKKRGRADGLRGEGDIALFPLIGFVFLVFGFVTSPITASISRSIESRADLYALSITRDADSGISGFKKLAYQSFVDPSPPAFLHFWFDSHPSLDERMSLLLNAASQR